MNNDENTSLFTFDSDLKSNEKSSIYYKKENEEESYNENRISYKLSLRKQKIQEKINNKRDFINKNNIILLENIDKIIYTDNDFLSGKIYDDLNNAYTSNSEDQIIRIIYSLVSFLNDKNNDNSKLIKLLENGDSSSNIQKNIKNESFPIASLIIKIGFETKQKIIFIYCFNFILNFTFISHRFCNDITKEKIISDIFDKLIFFYPNLIENKNNEKIFKKIVNLNEDQFIRLVESYYVSSQILKLFGNLFISSDSYETFKCINFYEKIIYLLSIFDLDNCKKNNLKNKKILYEYFDTLLWLLNLFFNRVENIIINYYDKLIDIIPTIVSSVRLFYYTQEIEYLERIIDILEIFSDVNEEFTKKIAYSDGINTLSNLFDYLFSQNPNECINLTSEIINKILTIFTNIFTIDEKYLQLFDYNIFAIVYQKLFSMYKFHHSNHFYLQNGLLALLCNFACINDINIIIQKFLLNHNIIQDLFKVYYQYHKKDVLKFINNVMIIQHKKVRDYILNQGAFDIIKNNICDYSGNGEEVVNLSIEVLFNMIKSEKAFNIRLLFTKIFNTSIPEKINEILNNEEDIIPERENMLKSIITDFEEYEKSIKEN